MGRLAGGSITRRFRVLTGGSAEGLPELEVRARRGRVLLLAGGSVAFSSVSDSMNEEVKASRLGQAMFGSIIRSEESFSWSMTGSLISLAAAGADGGATASEGGVFDFASSS